MTDNSRALMATVAGAVIGGAVGYLFFTDRGRELRRQFEPTLEDYARELDSFRITVEKAAAVASEGWKLLNESITEPGQHALRHQAAHQTSPF